MPRPADPTAKDALLTAARAEFAKKGLRGARVEDITAACGLSKGAFYLHFESKEACFQELVSAFLGEMGRCSDDRHAEMQGFVAGHGALSPRDFRDHSDKLRAFTERECQHDLNTLEIMWRYRDVLDVLVSGCQGTTFEGTLWDILDGEQARVAEAHRSLQGAGCCRADVPPELFGALVIGTYLLVGKQMARAQAKPDLALWARTLQRLIREGSVPREDSTCDVAPRDPSPAGESKRRRAKAVAKPKQTRTAAVRSTR